MDVYLGLGRFRAFDVALRDLQRQIFGRVPGNTAAVRIKSRLVEIVAIFIRFPSCENAAFDLDIAPNETGGSHTEGDVRRILPMMSDRRIRIIHRGRTVHERWGS